MINTRRRDVLKGLAALGLSVVPGRALPDHATAAPADAAADVCAAGNRATPLFVPGRQGLFGRLAPDGARLTMRAASVGGGRWRQGYIVEHRGVRFVNPTLLLQRGEALAVDFDNGLREPTSVHWHGLAVATRDDGAITPPVAPGERYAYGIGVRDRGALYWYHPHPHGLTAGQMYGGMFGTIEVEDADERAVRAALDLRPGENEIPLLLQDHRGPDYAASDVDRIHGWLGSEVLVNGVACPYLDVATRIYRLRVLNASNARTYLLGFRSADGAPLPFTLIGTDDGLLPEPRRCDQVFVATAERIDVLVDLSDAAVGDNIVLETRAFDPMHMEMATDAARGAVDHAAMGHAMPPSATDAASAAGHVAIGHGASFPEGTPKSLLHFRVRKRIAYRGIIPARLSTVAPIDTARAPERPLRLGFAKARWRINDRVFAMGETPIVVRRDTVETWLVRNYFTSMPHAMHLHGFHFQVIARQTSPAQVAALKVDAAGRLATDLGWKDTVLIWPGESVRLAIDFTMPFADEQTYLFHCHNLEHEDGGMMLGVKVV